MCHHIVVGGIAIVPPFFLFAMLEWAKQEVRDNFADDSPSISDGLAINDFIYL